MTLAIKGRDDTPEQRAAIKKFMMAPKMRAELEARMAQPWNSWVGAWVGEELAAGDEIVYESDDGADRSIFRHLGPVENQPGLVELELENVQSSAGDEIRALIAEMAQTLPTDKRAELAASGVTDSIKARVSSVLRTRTDPNTLRPAYTLVEVRRTITHDGETTESHERHEYTFQWQ